MKNYSQEGKLYYEDGQFFEMDFYGNEHTVDVKNCTFDMDRAWKFYNSLRFKFGVEADRSLVVWPIWNLTNIKLGKSWLTTKQ